MYVTVARLDGLNLVPLTVALLPGRASGGDRKIVVGTGVGVGLAVGRGVGVGVGVGGGVAVG